MDGRQPKDHWIKVAYDGAGFRGEAKGWQAIAALVVIALAALGIVATGV